MSVLMWNYGAIASAHHDGRLDLRWAGKQKEVRAASYQQAMRFAERWIWGRLHPHRDRWKKVTRPPADPDELAALRELLSPARVRPLAPRVAAIPEAPEFESLNWRRLLPDTDLAW